MGNKSSNVRINVSNNGGEGQEHHHIDTVDSLNSQMDLSGGNGNNMQVSVDWCWNRHFPMSHWGQMWGNEDEREMWFKNR